MKQFEICERCKKVHLNNTHGCPSCEARDWIDFGHQGHFDLIYGWVCSKYCTSCDISNHN